MRLVKNKLLDKHKKIWYNKYRRLKPFSMEMESVLTTDCKQFQRNTFQCRGYFFRQIPIKRKKISFAILPVLS